VKAAGESVTGAGEKTIAEVLIERSPNGIMVTGSNGLIRAVNPAVHSMIPIVPDAVGRHPSHVLPVERLADAMSPAVAEEVEFHFESGNRVILVKVVPMDGGRLAILQDVTMFARAESHRREFVANVSHELRTPATSIAGYAETLLDDPDSMDEFTLEMVSVIHRNAQRLIALFDDLLYLSKIDARDGPLEVHPMALHNIINEALDKGRSPADEKQITLNNFVDEALVVNSNRDALGHIFGNLVENAIKYSQDGGMVSVRASARDEGRVLVEVIDVGFGIEPSLHERIFERFYRVDKGRSRAQGGTGLGLAIVKRLCHAVGASVDVKSKLGKGSVFRVLLPGAEDLAKSRGPEHQ
jgi:two-component system phosphate regulon sensor histidine kinase PhoR